MRRLSATRRERRTLIVGAALVMTMITLSRGLPAWRVWNDDAVRAAAEITAEAARAEASVHALRTTVDSLVARRERFEALAPKLVGVGSEAAIAGSLSLLVSGAARSAGVHVSSIHVGHDTAEDAVVRRIWASADLEGDTRGIATLLARLEGGPKLLSIRELSITQPDPAAPADRPEALAVRVRIEGLMIDPRIAEAEAP